MDEDLRYPIGGFRSPQELNMDAVHSWTDALASLPERLGFIVENLDEEKLALTYRPGSWNIAQLVNHLADSHMNGFMRYKLAITEDNPVIKPYDEKRFAGLFDGQSPDLEPSLQIIEGLHNRWVRSIKNLPEEQFHLGFVHPEGNYPTKVFQIIALYAWHGDHHLAHIKAALNPKNEG